MPYLQIWGVIIFLRLGWLVAYGGILLTIAVVVISAAITTVTTLSLSAIATNGRVKGGGAYFLISRSLGPELGGAIGVLFAAANAVAIALYLIGLAETVVAQLGTTWIDPAWDLRIIAFITLAVLTALVFVGISIVIKFQLVLLLLLILAFASFIAGAFLDPSREGADPAARALANRNWLPAFDGDQALNPAAAARLLSIDGPINFSTCLAIFFPAATGIMAGANISGDLKNPRTAIPNGTLLAIGLSTVVYILLVILIGVSAARTVDLNDGNYAGLFFDKNIMVRLSAEPWLVNLGIYAATLSSALASLVGAPRILQAVAKDNLFPFLRVFANGYGGNDEPLEAYALSVLVAAACVAIGDLNLVAPLVTSLFLLSYFLVNYACLAAELSRSPGWRPTFRFYSKYSAGAGALCCIGMLIFLDPIAGVASIFITACLFYYVKSTTASTVSWGSASEGSAYMAAVRTLSTLQRTQRHVKNWRPQFLVLVGGAVEARLNRAGLVHFMRHLGKGKGVTVYARVLSDSFEDYCRRKAELFPGGFQAANDIPRRELLRWLHRLRAPGFAQAIVAPTLRSGAQSLLQLGGLGQLRPNVVTLGIKQNWTGATEAECDEYVGMIGDAFDMDCGVAVVAGVRLYENLTAESDEDARRAQKAAEHAKRVMEAKQARLEADAEAAAAASDAAGGDAGADGDAAAADDASAGPATIDVTVDDGASGDSKDGSAGALDHPVEAGHARKPTSQTDLVPAGTPGAQSIVSDPSLRHARSVPDLMNLFEREEDEGGNAAVEADGDADDEETASGCCQAMSRACGTRLRPGNGVGKIIDVWWLSDDGGLTVMLPYLLSRSSHWRGAKLRVWVVSRDELQVARQQMQMQELLGEVRISAEVNFLYNDRPVAPSEEHLAEHAALNVERTEGDVSDQSKAYLRMGELIAENSKDASIAFVSLPVPRAGHSSRRYLSWLRALSTLATDGVPVVMLRGNNSPVLTYFT
jgi:amino acid transporter